MASLRKLSIAEFIEAHEKTKDPKDPCFGMALQFNHIQLFETLMDFRKQKLWGDRNPTEIYRVLASEINKVGYRLSNNYLFSVLRRIYEKPIEQKVSIINKTIRNLNLKISNSIYFVEPPADALQSEKDAYNKDIYLEKIYTQVRKTIYDLKKRFDYEYRACTIPIHDRVEASLHDFEFDIWRKRVISEAPADNENKLPYFMSIISDLNLAIPKYKDGIVPVTLQTLEESEAKSPSKKPNNLKTFEEFIQYQIDTIKKQIDLEPATEKTKSTSASDEAQIEKPKRKRPVPHSFTINEKFSEFLDDVFLELKDSELIAGSHLYNHFKKIFSASKINTKIIWLRRIEDLHFFIQQLHDQEIIKPCYHHKWKITVKCFLDLNGKQFEESQLSGAHNPSDTTEIKKVLSKFKFKSG